jgi:DNA invertase Pin-like site-specific DNA recombinase
MIRDGRIRSASLTNWRNHARGRRHKAARGGFAYGAPPFGKQAQDKALVPEQREAAAVARIVELRRAGRSYREIARTLDADGLQPRKAEHWSPMAVRNVAVREMGGAA